VSCCGGPTRADHASDLSLALDVHVCTSQDAHPVQGIEAQIPDAHGSFMDEDNVLALRINSHVTQAQHLCLLIKAYVF